jgi:hypothetical protein
MVSVATVNPANHLNLTPHDPVQNIYRAEQPEQPDISYHPDEGRWKSRTEDRLRESPFLPSQPLPDGFPLKLESPLVWEGKDWTSETQWVYDLSRAELEEIEDAVKYFKSKCAFRVKGLTSSPARSFEPVSGLRFSGNIPPSITGASAS